MRIYLYLTPNQEIVPFNYQQSLVGAFHKWLGENELHDDISLYSLSWLGPGNKTREGLNYPNGTVFYISSPLQDLHKKAVTGIFQDQVIRWGMRVAEVRMRPTPQFGHKERFWVQSPILIKRRIEDRQQYFFPEHDDANTYLTETLQHKLQKANLTTDVSIRFDPNYTEYKIKKARYKGIDIKGTLCPVLVEGDPRAVAFAWEVGIGNSTGIGFGAVR